MESDDSEQEVSSHAGLAENICGAIEQDNTTSNDDNSLESLIIFKYFQLDEEKGDVSNGKCKHCRKTFTFKDRQTSNLVRHLVSSMK